MARQVKYKYNADSIQVLKGLEAVRKRVGMYVGDSGEGGYHHILKEIVDNGFDEVIVGCCNEITVSISEDQIVTVEDNGRGIPVDIHKKEKISALDLTMTRLHAGGKFGGKDSAFVNSSGLHGVGAACTNALSKWMEVTVFRDGKEYFRRYNYAEPTQKSLKINGNCSKNKTGTIVKFKPDDSIFKDCKYNKERIAKYLKDLSYLNPNVKVNFIWQDESPIIYLSKDGLREYVNDSTKGKNKLHEIISIKSKSDMFEAEMVFVYDDEYDSNVLSFANNIFTQDGGVHYNAALDSLCKVIEEYADNKKLLKKYNLKSVNKRDVLEGLNLIISVKISNPEFGGQTKTKLNNEDIRQPLGTWIKDELAALFKKKKDIASIIVDKIVQSMKSRSASQKAKDLIRNKKGLNLNIHNGKLKDCTSNKPELCELHICEGDSAGGSLQDARDRNYQAIFPLRGKILNVNDVTLNKALDNNEIKSLISVLGITVTSNGCELDNLKYHKIIIDTDADVDGQHIKCLLITFFNKFCPEIIRNGHLYVCELPLYKIKWKTETKYIKNDKELEQFKKSYGKYNLEISRFKGLGEMDADELRETAMDKKTRILSRIKCFDKETSKRVIDELMGKDVSKRKEFLSDRLNFGE